MSLVALAATLLSLDASLSQFDFEGATVRALHLRESKSSFVVASVEACPFPEAASAASQLTSAGKILISSTYGGCSTAFLNRLRGDLAQRQPSAWSQVRVEALVECSLGESVVGAEPRPDVRRVIPRECLAVEFTDSRTGKPVVLLASGPVAAAPQISAQIETRFRQQGFGMPVILLPAGSPDVKAKFDGPPYSMQVAAFGLLKDVRRSKRKPVGRVTLESEGAVSLLRFDSRAILAVPAVPSGFLQRYLGRHLGIRRDFFLTNAGTMPEAVDFNGAAPGIRRAGLEIAFAAGRILGRDPMAPLVPPTEDLRSSLQKSKSNWTFKLCGPAEVGVQGKYGAGAWIAGEGRIEVAPVAKRNLKADTTIAFWVNVSGKNGKCFPGNLVQGFGVSLSLSESCSVSAGRNETLAEITQAGWTHFIVRIKGDDLTGSVQINGKKKIGIRRPSAGEPRWIVGGAGSALLVSDFAVWDRILRDDFVPFLIDGSVPKWIFTSGKGDAYPAQIEPNTYEPPTTYPPQD